MLVAAIPRKTVLMSLSFFVRCMGILVRVFVLRVSDDSVVPLPPEEGGRGACSRGG